MSRWPYSLLVLLLAACWKGAVHAATGVSGAEVYTNVSARSSRNRLDMIKGMYAFEGFVYSLDSCPSKSQLAQDFQNIKSFGARTVITFSICGSGKDSSYYEDVLSAAVSAELYVIPLVWTLLDSGQTFSGTVVPIMKAVVEAVIKNPVPVIAVALGDEPLYDNDAGSADNLAKYILGMKSDFTDAGLVDIPVSISDMAYGWQSAGDISAMVAAVDFFMINDFPYFSANAQAGGSDSSWTDFVSSVEYFESIAKGKPLLVTQTGWPSNKNLWSPNSADIAVSIESEQAYWELLDSHCNDFFKAKNIGWMWRSFNDNLDGWGALTTNGKQKWEINAKQTC